jgi:hypothetical protein
MKPALGRQRPLVPAHKDFQEGGADAAHPQEESSVPNGHFSTSS